MGILWGLCGALCEGVEAKRGACGAALYEDPPLRESTSDGRPYNWKVTSWNVDGVRAWVRKGGIQVNLWELIWDLWGLWETKCGSDSVPSELSELELLPHKFWGSAVGKSGYSGVGLLSRTEPIRVTHGIGRTQKWRFLPQKWLL
uniref:Endonuclease/exonuclease/phosphatase domain-containing protein n=1 Tax=Coturnix japonica TaxID=93934 RepID=A0A8C2SNY9_COTJA